jgi:SPX domain protein involved in polyphosphate accumulation
MINGDGNAFHRYEVKYLVDRVAVPELRSALARLLDRDSYCGAHGYPVWSVYYDTADLRFYWDKIEGRPFRRKLRMRFYGDAREVDADAAVYVEIKQRAGRMTEKRRVRLAYGSARALCDERTLPSTGPEPSFQREVLKLIARLDLRPVTTVGYQREAFVGRDNESDLRVTLDRDIRAHTEGLDEHMTAQRRPIVSERQYVLEIKAALAVPGWLTNLTAQHHLAPIRLSKYCQSVEALDHAPCSVFHVDAAG